MSKKNFRTFVMCSILILVALCGFSIGLALNAIIDSKFENQTTHKPQILIVPKESGKDKENPIITIRT